MWAEPTMCNLVVTFWNGYKFYKKQKVKIKSQGFMIEKCRHNSGRQIYISSIKNDN